MILLKISKKPHTVKDVKKDALKKIFNKVKKWSKDIQKHQEKSRVQKEINKELIDLDIGSNISKINIYFYLEEEDKEYIVSYLQDASKKVLDNPYGTIISILDPIYVYLEQRILECES